MKTLVLDIGGIFFYPAWRLNGIPEASKILKVTEGDLQKALTFEKRLFYTGQISEQAYWTQILKVLNRDSVSAEFLMALYRSYVQPVPETLSMLPNLASNYNLITCNNCPKEWMDYRISLASLKSFFSEFHTSGYIGHMKPDDEMYSKIFLNTNTNLVDMVYIDDNEEYAILVNKKYGLETQTYRNPEDLQFWIR